MDIVTCAHTPRVIQDLMIAALKIFRGAKSSKQVYPEIEAILQEKKSQEDVQQVQMRIYHVS